MIKTLGILIICLFILIAGGILIWQFWSGDKIVSPTPSPSPTPIVNEAADIEFLKKSPLFDWDTFEFGSPKTIIAAVQNAPYYGPINDPELYQLEQNLLGDEFCQTNPDDYEYCSNFLFAESRTINLKEYLGEMVKITYRPIKRAIMGEQPIVIVDSIASMNWETYTNQEFGYEMKYPNFYYISENSNYTFFRNEEYKENPSGGCEFSVYIKSNPLNKNLEDWFADNSTEAEFGTDEHTESGKLYYNLKQVQLEKITVDGQEALKFYQVGGYPGDVMYLLVKKDVYIVEISYFLCSPELKTFEQMLSTFKFIN